LVLCGRLKHSRGSVVTNAMTADRAPNPRVLRDFYGMSPATLDLRESLDRQGSPGFFRYGPELVCYGESSSGTSPDIRLAGRYDALNAIRVSDSYTYLPFEFSSVIENLRTERYTQHLSSGRTGITKNPVVRKAYYLGREFLPVAIRRHLQKAYFKDWQRIPFPNWPVDFTVDSLHEEFLKLAMNVQGLTKIPFIWFWPEGASSCAVLTHDVETAVGRDFSSKLMDLDHSYGFRASFQVVPEKRYKVPRSYWNEIRSRGFEFNVHDLNHDSYLFQERSEFERRAKLINGYIRTYEARGFRAGAMYRNLNWYNSFDFSYDMSVPNVAHLEPQRGGCCTVMPFFVGKILELPLTTSQDYSVFNILEEYSIELWKKQIAMILKRNGLMTFLSHPDYLIDLKPRGVYDSLLTYLRKICDRHNVWHALPGEVDRWWRDRHRMKLVNTNGNWQIEGPESHRARIAYANLDNGRLVYSLDSTAPSRSDVQTQGRSTAVDGSNGFSDQGESRLQEITDKPLPVRGVRVRRLP
jgi:hypothetical protein